jgi:hypothetical protein
MLGRDGDGLVSRFVDDHQALKRPPRGNAIEQ